MQKGEIIRYVDMTIAEGMNLQRGMNYNIQGKAYHIILMSVPMPPMQMNGLKKRIRLFMKGTMFKRIIIFPICLVIKLTNQCIRQQVL